MRPPRPGCPIPPPGWRATAVRADVVRRPRDGRPQTHAGRRQARQRLSRPGARLPPRSTPEASMGAVGVVLCSRPTLPHHSPFPGPSSRRPPTEQQHPHSKKGRQSSTGEPGGGGGGEREASSFLHSASFSRARRRAAPAPPASVAAAPPPRTRSRARCSPCLPSHSLHPPRGSTEGGVGRTGGTCVCCSWRGQTCNARGGWGADHVCGRAWEVVGRGLARGRGRERAAGGARREEGGRFFCESEAAARRSCSLPLVLPAFRPRACVCAFPLSRALTLTLYTTPAPSLLHLRLRRFLDA